MSGAFSPPTHAPDCLMGMAGQVRPFFCFTPHHKKFPMLTCHLKFETATV